MLVIELCKEHDTEFQIGVKKYIWQKIAREISEKTKTSVTPQQCDTKLKRLKITYKQVKKHNASSGQCAQTMGCGGAILCTSAILCMSYVVVQDYERRVQFVTYISGNPYCKIH
jgi:hypothetical protein